jgi:DNA repair exonuclease SbcCD ATPase subunit
MKTLSVKQVAEVLGVGTRAIIKRLDKKQLKGTRRVNKYGTEEWWIYPNSEIKAALERAGRIDILGPQDTYSEADVVDADEELIAPDDDDIDEAPNQTVLNESADWSNEASESTQKMADGVWNNIIGRFLGELKERDQLIGEMRGELADKDRQLKLLPDFQKEAEIRRQEAEAQELKAIALSKQIQAMKTVEQDKALEIEKLKRIETEILPTLERQLEQERVQREKELTEAQNQLSALETDKQEAEEAKAKLEESLQKEIDRLKEEKEEQAKLIQTQFETLNQKLEKLQKPQKSWLQKLFSSPES